MSLEIPEKLSAEEWSKLPDNQKPMFLQSDNDPAMYEYAVPVLARSMKNAKSERDKLKEELEKASQRTKVYEQFGDPDKISDLLQREQMLMDGTKNLEEGMKKAAKDAEERWGGMVKDLRKENDSLKSMRLNDFKESVINSLLTNSGVDPEYADEVKMALGRRIKAEEREGKIRVVVVSADNPNELEKDNDTFEPLTPEKFLLQYRAKKAKFFKGETEGSGSGFPPNGRGRGSASFDDKDPKTWTFNEKKEFMQRYGGAHTPQAQSAYAKLMNSWADKRKKSA